MEFSICDGEAITCQLTPLLERYFLFPLTVKYKEKEIYVPIQKLQGSFIPNLLKICHEFWVTQ